MSFLENRRVTYQAIFLNPEDVKKLIEMQKDKLPKEVKNMHCTFKFQPSQEEIKKFSELLGKDIELTVVGYSSDGKAGYFTSRTENKEKITEIIYEPISLENPERDVNQDYIK